jgi:hypothetical protein
LNGRPLANPIDCFLAENVVNSGALDLGLVHLEKGPATVRVEVVGTNPRSTGRRFMWGVDCFVLKPAD